MGATVRKPQQCNMLACSFPIRRKRPLAWRVTDAFQSQAPASRHDRHSADFSYLAAEGDKSPGLHLTYTGKQATREASMVSTLTAGLAWWAP